MSNAMDDTMDTSFSDNTAWSEEVLRRLQCKAKPEPIKVACMHTPSRKPHYLDEGYHGRISKDKVSQLLAGKTGRYLTRESTSKPGDIVLSVNCDGEVQHYRLIYDGQTYKTDSSESGYNSITELLVHILELWRRCSALEENKRKPKVTPHQFESHTFLHPKWCEVCGGFLWGLRYQGVKCEFCGLSVHKSCKAVVPESCSKAQIAKTDRSQSLTPLSKIKGSPPQPRTPEVEITARKMSSKYSCYFFNKSLRFLTQNFSVRLFDLDNNLNKCYCEDCLLGSRSKFPYGNSSSAVNLSQKMLQNWCRFPICPPQAVRRNLKEFEVAYMGCPPDIIKSMTNGWLEGQEQYVSSTRVVPSMAYLNELFTSGNMSFPFRDPLDNETRAVQTVLEIFIEPGCFRVTNVGEGYIVEDQYDSNGLTTSNEMEVTKLNPEVWEVADRSKVYPGALLIRILRERSLSSP